MSDIEIETSTETVYRWKCHRCGEVRSTYSFDREQVERSAERHEKYTCAKKDWYE